MIRKKGETMMEHYNIKERINCIKKDKNFRHKTLAIAIPIALQTLLNTTLNMVDTLMIGSLGDTSIAAVGLANKVFFVFILLIFGVVSGSSILTSQYWGKRDVTNIRRVLGMSLLLGIGASILFTVPSLIWPGGVMRIFTPSKSMITIGTKYLVIVCLSYPIIAVTNSYVALLRGVNQVKAPVVISVFAILINITFNYLLIYGKFGFPELGVAGAATATVIARIFECAALLCVVYIHRGPAAARIKELLDFNITFVKIYFKHVSTVIVNEFMWGLGVTMYSLVYGRMGDIATAAITITQTVEQIFMVIFQGIGGATAIIIGNVLGANKLKKAEEYAKNFMFLQFIFGILILIVCLLIKGSVISLFHATNEVARLVDLSLTVFAIYAPFKMFNFINIVGILRSGGDTKITLFLDVTGVWLIGVPLAVLGGLVFKQPIYIVYAMVLVEEIYKFVLGYIRYRKKIWLRNIVND